MIAFLNQEKFVEIKLDERNTQPNDEYYKINFKPSYLVCIRFNAKNTYGGYVGWEWQGYLILKIMSLFKL